VKSRPQKLERHVRVDHGDDPHGFLVLFIEPRVELDQPLATRARFDDGHTDSFKKQPGLKRIEQHTSFGSADRRSAMSRSS
jgi:hypothetical protein